MTQLLVEILVVVLVAVVLVKLPGLNTLPVAPLRTRLRDVAVAIAAGSAVALTVIAVVSGPFDRSITEYFEWQSAPIGLGRNIVNVVLVDFRALDTLGEIAVIAIAGLAVYALLKLKGTSTQGGGDAR
jgi:multicomponent Na+:H+ antiporter subunit A